MDSKMFVTTTVKHKLIGVLKNEAKVTKKKIEKYTADICKQAVL